jgi:hypothetical protein
MRTLLLTALLALALPALALEPVFTYQGKLYAGAGPASGAYEFEFELFDDPLDGVSLAGPATAGPLHVEDGLFLAEIDFGFNPFAGLESWLEIRVRPGGSSDPFEVLEPRQRMAPAPNALHAEGVAMGAVGSQQLALGAVTAPSLAPGAVSATALADGAVGTLKLADGAVTSAKVNLNQIQARLASCPPGQAIRSVSVTGIPTCERVPQIDLRRFTRSQSLLNVLPEPSVFGQRFGFALDPAGRPFVSAYDASLGNLVAIHCNDPECTSFQINTVDAEGIAGDYSSVDFHRVNGRPIISYWSQTLNALRLATCGDASCATVQSIVTVDSGNVGQWTQIMVDGGDAWIAYHDYGQSQLKLARTPLGTIGTTAIRIASDTPGDGAHTDMTIVPVAGGNDLWIAHGNSLEHSVRLTRCSRSTTVCSTSTVDSGSASAALGRGNAVVLGPNGFPAVATNRSNADGTVNGVRLFICANLSCGELVAAIDHNNCSTCSSHQRPLLWWGMDGALGFTTVLGRAYRCGDIDCSVIHLAASSGLAHLLVGVQRGPDGMPWFMARSTDRSLTLRRCGNRFCSTTGDGRY